MIQNNNLSVLPWYDNITLQNHRKSYAYGAIYPLYAPANVLLPFQIMRKHRYLEEIGEQLTPLNVYRNYYINASGLLESAQSGFNVSTYNVSNIRAIHTEGLNNAAAVYDGALLMVAKDSDNNILGSLSVPGSSYNGTWILPENAVYLDVQTTAMGTSGNISEMVINTFPVKEIKMYDKRGEYIADITQDILNAGLQIIPKESNDMDVIVFPGTKRMETSMKDGQYYLTLSDGLDIWFSEIMTITQDITPYLKVEWYDEEDLISDAGIIIYKNPMFINRLYLCTELGKPEYPFEEEGITRDGYFFPKKQISEKKYRFTILAPEYLCDVMRLIRMADFVKITDKYGQTYRVDTILITPQWQTQGDLASVEIEFETNTVVKKIGRGVVRILGDFNNDYNKDYN